MDAKFGTSGLRGLAAGLLAGVAADHVCAFAQHLIASGLAKSGDRVFLARDRRASSAALCGQCKSALLACALVPVDCGQVPTPALAQFAFARNSAAIMVTGSHIPADRNGLKFYLPGAEITKADEAAIVLRVAAMPKNSVQKHTLAVPANGNGEMAAEVMGEWHARHAQLLAPGFLAGLRIGIHEHSGVAAGFFSTLLEGFGAQIHRFGATADFTPVDTEAVGPQMIALYRHEARSALLNAIVSTDADGDRPLFADETGQPLPGDLLGWLACLWLGADRVATPVTSNSAIRSFGGVLVQRTKVGSPFVIAAMDSARANGGKRVSGFEANGGFLTGSDMVLSGQSLSALPTRDCTLPILAALEAMQRLKIPASQLLLQTGFRATAGDRLQDYSTGRSAALLARLASNQALRDEFMAPIGLIAGLDMTDGMRFTLIGQELAGQKLAGEELAGEEIVHFRASGNAPEMRCYCEAATQVRALELLEGGLAALARFQG